MEIKHAIAKKIGDYMKLLISDMEKPNINWKNESTAKQTAKEWDESFKEYSVKDEKQFKDFIIQQWQQGVIKYPHRSNYENEIKKGISIDHRRVGIEEKYCLIKCTIHDACDKEEQCLHPRKYAILTKIDDRDAAVKQYQANCKHDKGVVTNTIGGSKCATCGKVLF